MTTIWTPGGANFPQIQRIPNNEVDHLMLLKTHSLLFAGSIYFIVWVLRYVMYYFS